MPDELHTNLIKQRSLTPEKRSLTPDDRSKRKTYRTKRDGIQDGCSNTQNSLLPKQSSSSRSSTLEKQQQQQQHKYDEKQPISRSSSSSSYSGGIDHHQHDQLSSAYRKQHYRQIARNVAENRIRRSRYVIFYFAHITQLN